MRLNEKLARFSRLFKPLAYLAILGLALYLLPTRTSLGWHNIPLNASDIMAHKGQAFLGPYQVPPWLKLLPAAEMQGTYVPSNYVIRMTENGKPLGPVTPFVKGIEQTGSGKYFWSNTGVVFSTLDNSDPRHNGRSYSVLYPIILPHFYFGLLLLFGISWCYYGSLKKGLFSFFYWSIIALSSLALLSWLVNRDFCIKNLVGFYGKYPADLVPTENSKGYRDIEHNIWKTKGIPRIVVLGDSVTYGSGLRDDDLFTRKLATKLGDKVEVINMAKPGWSTLDEISALENEAIEYGPDIVVFAVCVNDVEPVQWKELAYPSTRYFQTLYQNPLAALVDTQLVRLLSGSQPSIGGMVSPKSIHAILPQACFGGVSVNRYEDYKGNDVFGPIWPEWEAEVRRSGEFLRERNILAFAVNLPLPRPVASCDAVEIIYETMLKAFAGSGFNAHNLYYDFPTEYVTNCKRYWVFPNDGHPNAAINEWYAQQIYNILIENPEAKRVLGQ
jgi:hypothetical protein